MKRIYATSPISGLQIAALVVMILTNIYTVVWPFLAPSLYEKFLPALYYYSYEYLRSPLVFLTLIPLTYTIPMTVSYYHKIKDRMEPIGCGFIICTFIFFSPIAAILMLIDR